MFRKLKTSPQRRSTALNLLIAHLVFHIIFVFVYWFALAASLSFAELSSAGDYAAAISNALTNHLGLLCLLVVHASAVFAKKYWKRRQQNSENKQVDSALGHLTDEQKLELLLDEVAELREALHERDGSAPRAGTDFSAGRLRDEVQQDNESITLEEYRLKEKVLSS